MTNTEILNQLCRDRESSMRRILEATDNGEFDAALDAMAGDKAKFEQSCGSWCEGCPVCTEVLA